MGNGALVLLLAAAGLGGYAIYEATKDEKENGDGPLPPAPGHPCPTFEQVEAFAKERGYDVYYVDNQAAQSWKAPKAEYVSNPKARAFSAPDCGFFKWITFEGAKASWVRDLATDAELGAYLALAHEKQGPKIEINIPSWAPIDMSGAEGLPPELQVPAEGVLGALGQLFKTSGCADCGGKHE